MKNLSDLRILFYEEHARDRRLTLINYFLILCIASLFLGILLYLGVDLKQFLSNLLNTGTNDGSPTAIYYSLLPVVIVAIIFGYPAFLLWKISKRPGKIERLLLQAGKGVKPSAVHDSVEYKITVPLLKINLKLCPVTYVTIHMEGDYKPYVLPIKSAYVPDMKILLSGTNIAAIDNIKRELFANAGESSQATNAEEENSAPSPIKTEVEFRAFIDKEMKEELTFMESSRKSSRKTMFAGIALSGVVIACLFGYFIYKNTLGYSDAGASTYNPLSAIIPIIVGSLFIALFFNIFMRKKAVKNADGQSPGFEVNSFKDNIITRIIHFINPSLTYVPIAHLGLEEVEESGLFTQKQYKVDGSDQISGRHSGVPFISSNLSLYYKENYSEEREAPKCAFSGQFFIARFNKSFSTPVYIIPRKNKYDTTSYLTGNTGEEVKLEDPEFMKIFKVYAHDQVTARYILTPSLMERIKELSKRDKGAYHFAFYNRNITVANNSGKGNFDVDYSRSLTDKDNQLLIDFYTEIRNQFAIIDELKLNINIWKK